MFIWKDVLKICCKFTGEHPYRCMISIKFIGITLRHGCSPVNLLHIFWVHFTKNTNGRLLLFFIRTRIFDLNFKVIISDNHFSLKNVLIQYDTFPFPKHLLSFRSRKSHLFYRVAVLKSLGKFPMKTSKMES